MTKHPWTSHDDQSLRDKVRAGYDNDRIARLMDRPPESIARRMIALKLTARASTRPVMQKSQPLSLTISDAWQRGIEAGSKNLLRALIRNGHRHD